MSEFLYQPGRQFSKLEVLKISPNKVIVARVGYVTDLPPAL